MHPYPGIIIHVVADLTTGSQKCIPAMVTDVELDRLILTLFAPAGIAAARRVAIMRNPGAFHGLDECSLWWDAAMEADAIPHG